MTRAKIEQAKQLVAESDAGCWITFVRETCGGSDPALPLILDGGLTWHSALIITPTEAIAVLGNYDADPLEASGDWDRVVPYIEDFAPAFKETLESACSSEDPIALNYSVSDSKADGITHGMMLTLQSILSGTTWHVMSAENIVGRLRGEKTPEEQRRIAEAIKEGDLLFIEMATLAKTGTNELAIQQMAHKWIDDRSLGYGWDKVGNPIVNSGPNSMVGHGVPSPEISVEPGHIFHVDLGVIKDGYSSDIQRCWYVSAGEALPEDVIKAAEAVNASITEAASLLRPGCLGCDIDAAARRVITSHGYPEYMHALGHQVGQVAHDGGAILGPEWPRYGTTPTTPIRENEVYTIELGVDVEGRGYLGLEEIVVVTNDGCRFLSDRQFEIPVLLLEG